MDHHLHLNTMLPNILRMGVAVIVMVACSNANTGNNDSVAEPQDGDTVHIAPGATILDPPTLDSSTVRELIAAREAVWRAYFQGDSARLVELLPEKMFAMHGDRAQIIADAQGFASGGGKFVGITFSDDRFFVRGEVAQVQSRYRVALTNAGKPDSMTGFAIELFEKRDGRWINPSWHLDETDRQ